MSPDIKFNIFPIFADLIEKELNSVNLKYTNVTNVILDLDENFVALDYE